MRFTRFYGGGATGTPSRAAFLTGKNTGHSGIRGDRDLPLASDELTVGNLLKNAGYATGAIGVWGLGGSGTTGYPARKGFGQWLGCLNDADASEYYPRYLDRYSEDHQPSEKTVELKGNLQAKNSDYSLDYFAYAAVNFVRICEPEKANNFRPFFLYLPVNAARANARLPKSGGAAMQVPEDSPYSDESWPQAEKNRAAMIGRLDRAVGKILDKLRDTGATENTMVIFTSANGPANEGGVNADFFQSAGKCRGVKGDLYEGGIRVPFVVRWPSKIRAGSTCDIPYAAWDFPVTAVEAAGLIAPTNTDGLSLLPAMTGIGTTNTHDFLYWESHKNGFKQAARMGDWKAVRNGMNQPLELYNLAVDPSEKTDVALDHADIVAQFEKNLKTARTEDPNWPVLEGSEQAHH
jgi:arylsulfatase A-like enzyme